MSLNDWIKEQEQRGITTFSFQQIRCVFAERSEKTLKTDINRLTLSKRIQNVYKGFYVIIPTQYQLKGLFSDTILSSCYNYLFVNNSCRALTPARLGSLASRRGITLFLPYNLLYYFIPDYNSHSRRQFVQYRRCRR